MNSVVFKGTFKQDQRITCKGITTATQICGQIFKNFNILSKAVLWKKGGTVLGGVVILFMPPQIMIISLPTLVISIHI
jgi:hypothetical protein